MCDGYGVVAELVCTQRWSYNRGDSRMVEYTIRLEVQRWSLLGGSLVPEVLLVW